MTDNGQRQDANFQRGLSLGYDLGREAGFQEGVDATKRAMMKILRAMRNMQRNDEN
jgi:hypothetical protein